MKRRGALWAATLALLLAGGQVSAAERLSAEAMAGVRGRQAGCRFKPMTAHPGWTCEGNLAGCVDEGEEDECYGVQYEYFVDTSVPDIILQGVTTGGDCFDTEGEHCYHYAITVYYKNVQLKDLSGYGAECQEAMEITSCGIGQVECAYTDEVYQDSGCMTEHPAIGRISWYMCACSKGGGGGPPGQGALYALGLSH